MILVLTCLALAAAAVAGMISGTAGGLALCAAGVAGLFAYRAMRGCQEQRHAAIAAGDSSPAQDESTERDDRPGQMESQAANTTRMPARPVNAQFARSCGVCVLDREFRVIWCSALAAGHLGIRMESDLGRPINRVLSAGAFTEYLAAGDYSRPLPLEAAGRPAGSLSVWVVPYLESQWLILSLDVTQAIELENTRRDGVADALHEMCSPITVLAGTIDAMRQFAFGPRRLRDSLDAMEEQCRRLQRTVEGLLSLSSLESAPGTPRDERVGSRTLLASIRAEAEALSGGRHRIVLDAATELDLIGSGGEIASAFRNIASNAVRYTPAGGNIRLTWRGMPDGGAEFAVEDDGIGIAGEHIPRLTERFFRVDGAHSGKTAGTGLGLAIVKDVLTRHQATLTVESEPGRGSRFAARFPAHRVVAEPVPEVVPAAASAAARAVRASGGQEARAGTPGPRAHAPVLHSAPSRIYGRVLASTAGRPRGGR